MNDDIKSRFRKLGLRAAEFSTMASAVLLIINCFGPRDTPSFRNDFDEGDISTIVAFGDSIVEGYMASQGWPDRLGKSLAARYPGVKVINAGHSGDTAADGLKRLEKDVISHEPDLVLVAFGLNDMKDSIPPDRFRKNMEGILAGLRSIGARPAFLTTTRLARGAGLVADPGPYNDVIRELAGEEKVFLVDVFEEFSGLNNEQNLLDVAHPNDRGHAKLAEIIERVLLNGG